MLSKMSVLILYKLGHICDGPVEFSMRVHSCCLTQKQDVFETAKFTSLKLSFSMWECLNAQGTQSQGTHLELL